MPGSPPSAGPFVYQLRVVLRGVSPWVCPPPIITGRPSRGLLGHLRACSTAPGIWSSRRAGGGDPFLA
jgi:hypothetical protein